MENDFYTAKELADILKIKKSTVYEMIKRGEIRSVKIGKQLRIPAEEIELRLNAHAAKPQAAQTVPPPALTDYSKPSGGELILCGQDLSLDCIANHFIGDSKMPAILRSHAGSYNSLYLLYSGRVSIATAHLWDEKTGEYNIPYIRSLLPGMRVVCVRLFGRMTGLYVQRGNPLGISSWEDLADKPLTMINREKGSGARVLLDEKLKKLKINRHAIKGYDNTLASHFSVASAVARGEADVAVGIERAAQLTKGIDFIPLQKEWYDMIFLAEQADSYPFRRILDYVVSEDFMEEMIQLADYDFSQNGRIIRI